MDLGIWDKDEIPLCPNCGKQMKVRVETIRLPEKFLACMECGTFYDMSTDQYYRKVPQPKWAE